MSALSRTVDAQANLQQQLADTNARLRMRHEIRGTGRRGRDIGPINSLLPCHRLRKQKYSGFFVPLDPGKRPSPIPYHRYRHPSVTGSITECLSTALQCGS
jgi:hypothetical protein